MGEAGETDVLQLLQQMQPILHPEEYVFCTIALDSVIEPSWQAIAFFREAEGLTMILPRNNAVQASLPFIYPCRMITLSVHSSLSAVGFLAAIASALAQQGISVNPVSAYYHDHLFVPSDRADVAMQVLAALSSHVS